MYGSCVIGWVTQAHGMKIKTVLTCAGVVLAAVILPASAAISDYSGIFKGRLKRVSTGVLDSTVVPAVSKGGRIAGAAYDTIRDIDDAIDPTKSVVRSDATMSGATLSGGTFKGKIKLTSTSCSMTGTAAGDQNYTFTFTRIYK